MLEVLKHVGWQKDFPAFLDFLRTDPRFYARTPEELLKEASYIAKRMDARLPSLFGRLPRQPYGVQAVPAALAPKYTSGRYSGSPRESSEPGWYWVNTYALEKRPLYNLETLTLHEAVPGHHLQGALAGRPRACGRSGATTPSRRSGQPHLRVGGPSTNQFCLVDRANASALTLFDIIRIDHFRGFAGFYEQMACQYFTYPAARRASHLFYARLTEAAHQSDAAAAEIITRHAMAESIDLWRSMNGYAETPDVTR